MRQNRGRAIREVVERAVADRSIITVLPPTAGGLTLLYRSAELTISNVVWAPHMRLFAHDHNMWACIGIYAGREDNEFFRRATDPTRGLISSGGKRLDTNNVTLLGDDTIHTVANPLDTPTGAIHVYGGDFVAQPRSQWREPDLVEEPYDIELVNQQFAIANAAQYDT